MKKFKIRFLWPLILSEFYWILTYIFYRYGIVKYPFAQDNRLLIFLGLCDLLFCAGYLAVLKLKSFSENSCKLDGSKIEKLIIVCTGISILIAIPSSIRNTGSWYPPIFSNLTDPGATYHRVTAGILENGILRIFGLFDFFPFMVFPLTFSAWDIIGKKVKIAGCFVAFYYLLIYCAGGRNMPCFLFAFSAIITYLAKMCIISKKRRVSIIRDSFICIFAILLVVTMFTINLKSRNLYSANVEEKLASIEDSKKPENNSNKQNNNSNNSNNSNSAFSNVQKQENVYLQYKDLIITKEQEEKCKDIGNIFPMYTNPYTKEYADPENLIYKIIPDSLKFTCVTGTMYVSSSYHVLSVALRMEHKWTYGFGFSEFLQSYIKSLTGIDIKALSFGKRAVELTEPPIVSTYGWGTAYTQLADDLTFPGVIIFFGFLGVLVGYLWMDIVHNCNIYGIPFCIQLALMIVFIPANCIVFNSGGYFTTFWGTLLIWIFQGLKSRKNRRNKAEIMA